MATTFLGTGSTRLLISVYNSNPAVLEQAYPPLLVVNSDVGTDGNGGALLRVAELYRAAEEPLGDVTGVAVTFSTSGYVLVSHADGEGAAITAFDQSSVRSLVSSGARGATVLMASTGGNSSGPALSYPVEVLPLGGLSFFQDNGDCYLLASDGSSQEIAATTYIYPMFDCDWFLPSSVIGGVLQAKTSFRSGGNVTGVVVFRHTTDTLLYAAVLRCAIVKGMDCRIEFSGMNVTKGITGATWTFNRTVLYSLVVPAGSVGLAFDPDTSTRGVAVNPHGPQFIFGCSGAAEANFMRVKSARKFLDGRLFVVDKPIFIAVPFGVKRNVAYATFLGYEILTPRCTLPLSDPCLPCYAPPCPDPPEQGKEGAKKRALAAGPGQVGQQLVRHPYGHGTSRYLADNTGCLSFEKQLFSMWLGLLIVYLRAPTALPVAACALGVVARVFLFCILVVG